MMKEIAIIFQRTLWVFGIVVLLSSCGLGLQESFEYKSSSREVPEFDMTVYDWVKSNQDSVFDYLSLAIDYAGMQEHFEAEGRTYFLLQDGAWATILEDLVDPNAPNPDDTITVEDIPIAKLKNLLLYHTIDERVAQTDVLAVDVHYEYQTMLEGEDGIMIIKRENLKFRLDINEKASGLLPAESRGARIFRHNYKFTNGLSHIATSYFRYKPF
ncbi:MAG: fasciclin domain-containing protein [Cyclobacteriaceae bacterium]